MRTHLELRDELLVVLNRSHALRLECYLQARGDR